MIRYLSAQSLAQFPKLSRTMFSDRAAQFVGRLGWPVAVDANGEERDQYDALNPIYVIWENRDGSHGGSVRFLPTIGRTMVQEHFSELTNGASIRSRKIWECTRFCVSPGAGPNIAPALMLGGLCLGVGQGLSHAVGVFDARMIGVYKRLGWAPAVLGQTGTRSTGIAAGLWAFEEHRRDGLLRKAGLSREISDYWYDRAFAPAGRMAETA
jgi:acyl homoserine lactone synthase